jgi:ElaB/YqjD/DUF883 family membrane-anchored ribosome-binding protein
MATVNELIANVTDLDRPEIRRQLDRARARLDDLDSQVRKLVQDRPAVAVGGALVFGYVLGRLLLRRR